MNKTKETDWAKIFFEPLTATCVDALKDLIEQPFIDDVSLKDLQSMNANRFRLQISNVPHELFEEFVLFSIDEVDLTGDIYIKI